MTQPRLEKPYKVLIVDDHKFLVELLAQKLSTHANIEIAGMANKGSTAVHVVKNEAVDIVLLDMELEEDDGLRVAKKLFEIKPELRIIGLSVHDSNRYPIGLLKMGGSGFISKKATHREIVEGIVRVADGEMAISPKIAIYIATEYDGTDQIDQLRKLTKKEHEIFVLIAYGYRMVEIGDALGVTEKTIHTHRANIRRKLEVKTDVELALIAMDSGLIDANNSDPLNRRHENRRMMKKTAY